MLKRAMLRVEDTISGSGAFQINTIHDAIVLEIPVEIEDEIIAKTCGIIESALPAKIGEVTNPPVQMKVEAEPWQTS